MNLMRYFSGHPYDKLQSTIPHWDLVNVDNYLHAKQKQPGCKKVRGQSEATMVISDQNL